MKQSQIKARAQRGRFPAPWFAAGRGVREVLTAGPRAQSKTPLRHRSQRGRFFAPWFAAGRGVREVLTAGPRAQSKTPLRHRSQRGRFFAPWFAAGRGVREVLTAGPRDAACAKCVQAQPGYLIFVTFLSLRTTSWAPPSTMETEETRVILAFCWSSGIVRAPQLHMVDLTLLRVRPTLSLRLPA